MGWSDAFPQGLIDNLTVDGKIYSVPANIHRANVVWANKTVLEDAGITAVPADIDALIADLDKLKAKGVKTPLGVGKDWTQVMLFEAVLISRPRRGQFTGLWNGDTDWARRRRHQGHRRLQEAADLHQHRPRGVSTGRTRRSTSWTARPPTS